MDFPDLRGRTFKGFLAEDEAARLYDLAREASLRGACLEIGSYCGLSAAYLGLGCREGGGVLYSIDHHRGSEEQQPGEAYFDPDLLDAKTGRIDTFPLFRRTLEDLSLIGTVIPIVGRSTEIAAHWRSPLALVFIDGGHTFEAAFNDYSSWVSHLIPGGYLAIHDLFPDPAKGGQAPWCVYNLALASGLFEALPTTGTLGILRRAPCGMLTTTAAAAWERFRT